MRDDWPSRRGVLLVVAIACAAAAFSALPRLVAAQESRQPPRPGPERLAYPTRPGAGRTESALPLSPDLWVPWSALAVEAWVDGNWEIYFDKDDGFEEYSRVTYDPASDIHPRLNRGATRIAFASNRDGDYEIYTMNRDGTGLVQLTHNDSDDVNPTWSPDGRRLAFESYRDGQAEIYVMDADGSNAQRLTTETGYDGAPAWSPDGTRIAFSSGRAGTIYVYVMNADGSSPVQLSSQPYSYDASWSPDGVWIAYDADSNDDGWLELWLMNADGSNAQCAYAAGYMADAWARSWSPDGRVIAFTKATFEWWGGSLYVRDLEPLGLTLEWGSISSIGPDLVSMNPDWATTDAEPPQSEIAILPAYTPARDFWLYWTGRDNLSGVWYYNVQYRVGADGEWVDWLHPTVETRAEYAAEPGTSVYFRVRASDSRYNLEPWPAEWDTWTTFLRYPFAGNVVDNRGTPLAGVPLTIAPEPLEPVATDGQGRYVARLVAAGPHTVSLPRDGYGQLPVTLAAPGDLGEIYLPPDDDAIQNGTFEAGGAGIPGWNMSGTLPVVLAQDARRTGDYGVRAGQNCPYPCLSAFERHRWVNHFDADADTDSMGNLHVAWYGQRPEDTLAVYHSVRSVHGTWSEPFELTRASTIEPVVAIDQDDFVHIIWGEWGTLRWRMRTPDGEWLAPRTIPLDMVGQTYTAWPLEAAVDRENNIHLLVYYGPNLLYFEGTREGGWERRLILSASARMAAMGLAPDGDVQVAWGQGSVIKYRVRTSGRAWGPAQALFSEQDYFVPEAHHVLVEPGGTVHLLFKGTSQLRHAMRSPDGEWSTPESIPNAPGQGRGDAAVDSVGRIHLITLWAWQDGVYYHRWSPASGWDAPVTLQSAGSPFRAAVAVDQHDLVHLLWTVGYASGVSYATAQPTTSEASLRLEQSVTIPPNTPSPTLSFMHRARFDLPGDATGLAVLVNDGVTVTQVLSDTGEARWSLAWTDLSAWAGKTVTLTYQVQQEAGAPAVEVWLDDISLGAAHPDLWAKAHCAPISAMPGETVVCGVDYGNRGGVTAEGTVLTVWPPNQVGVVAVAPPVPDPGARPLVWDLGTLGAQESVGQVTITATVYARAPLLTTGSLSAHIGAATAELEQANNQATSGIFIGHRVYVPLTRK